MNILGIDSSTKKLSIAVSTIDTFNNFKNLKAGRLEHVANEGFMVKVIPLIDRLLKTTGLQINSMDAFSVNRGPGDFTGTRIGMSVIKTFALIFNKPAFGIDALNVISVQAASQNCARISSMLSGNFNVYIVPVIDVKREEVFFSVYKASFAGNLKSEGKILYRNNEIFINKIEKGNLAGNNDFLSIIEKFFNLEYRTVNNSKKSAVFFCGTAFDSYKYLAAGIKILKQRVFLEKKAEYPQAEYLNLCALYRMANQIKGDENIIPCYAREFVAFGKKI